MANILHEKHVTISLETGDSFVAPKFSSRKYMQMVKLLNAAGFDPRRDDNPEPSPEIKEEMVDLLVNHVPEGREHELYDLGVQKISKLTDTLGFGSLEEEMPVILEMLTKLVPDETGEHPDYGLICEQVCEFSMLKPEELLEDPPSTFMTFSIPAIFALKNAMAELEEKQKKEAEEAEKEKRKKSPKKRNPHTYRRGLK